MSLSFVRRHGRGLTLARDAGGTRERTLRGGTVECPVDVPGGALNDGARTSDDFETPRFNDLPAELVREREARRDEWWRTTYEALKGAYATTSGRARAAWNECNGCHGLLAAILLLLGVFVGVVVSSRALENGRELQHIAQDAMRAASRECRVYAYFDAAEHGDDRFARDALELWKSSWRQAGWTPQVVSKADAARHPLYDKIVSKFDDPELGDYAHHFLRWLAVAVKGGGYMSQYFVANVNHEAPSTSKTGKGCSVLPNKGRLTVYEYPFVPSIVSGSSGEFEKAIDYFVSTLVDLRGPAYEFYTGWAHKPQNFGVGGDVGDEGGGGKRGRFGAFTDANVLGEMVAAGLAEFRDGSVFRSLAVIPDPPCDDITGRPLRFMVHVTPDSLCDLVRGKGSLERRGAEVMTREGGDGDGRAKEPRKAAAAVSGGEVGGGGGSGDGDGENGVTDAARGLRSCARGEDPSVIVASQAIGAMRGAANQCAPDKARLGGWLHTVRVAEGVSTFGGGGGGVDGGGEESHDEIRDGGGKAGKKRGKGRKEKGKG